MAFSKVVRDEIRAETERLRADIAKIDEELQAKQKLRAQKIDRLNSCQKLMEEDAGVVAVDFPPQVNGVERRATIDKDSLSASIITVLKNFPSPAKPVLITDTLRKAGFPEEGKTALNTKVNNELYRLVKKGTVLRTNNGYMARVPS